MGFSLASATTAAKNFVSKKLDNINLASNLTGTLNQLQNKIPGIGGSGATAKPIPGKIVDAEVDNKKNIDINGELLSGKDLTYIERKPGESFPNELGEFDSYNCIFTLSVLNGNSINFPDETYRRDILGPIIVKSGGTGDIINSNAIRLTNFKSKANPSGRFDSFIDNVKINGIIGYNKASGNTNSTTITFQITEPYSTGLFFQTVQVAAFQAGYMNWLDMPILLSIEFKGHLTANQQNFRAKLSRKHIPLKVNAIEMRVSGQGTVYDCSAIPWNERAFSVDNNKLTATHAIQGSTVREMLQTGTESNKLSLQNVINQRLKDVASKLPNPVDPDRVLILFPIDLQTGKGASNDNDNSSPPRAVTSPASTSKDSDMLVFSKLGVELDGDNLVQNAMINPIGGSPMGFEADVKRPEAIFGKEDAVYDEKTGTWTRGDIQIQKTGGIAKFSQGTSITDAINEIILASDYGRRALDPANIDSNQKVNWWRIETQFYILSTSKKLKGNQRNPTLSVFRVVPYKIDYTNFVSGSQPAKKLEEKKMNAVKKYEYLYTGKNIDILDFNIEFKTSFYQALNADSGKNNESVEQNLEEEEKDQSGKNIDTERDASDILGASNLGDDQANYTPGQAQTKVISRYTETSMNAKVGGATAGEDASTIAARQFNKALNDGSDMITLNMKILGDPFYIADSGIGNYSAKATNIPEMNSDGAINTQDGEVYITVNFRNPIDLNPNAGLYDFGGKGKIVPEFSGLYRIFQLESSFEKNIFTQQLKLVRMMNQDLKPTESSDKAPAKSAFTPNNSYDGVEGGP
jgi:hypothetical protein